MASAIGIDIGRASATAVKIRKRGGSLALEKFVHVSLDELRDAGVDPEDPRAVAVTKAARARLAFDIPASSSTAESTAYCGAVNPSGRSLANKRGHWQRGRGRKHPFSSTRTAERTTSSRRASGSHSSAG